MNGCPGCSQPMTFRSRMSLTEMAEYHPSLAERALDRGVTSAEWDVFECDHCDCGCRRFDPVQVPKVSPQRPPTSRSGERMMTNHPQGHERTLDPSRRIR